MTALGMLWFALIAVLLIGYFALDGFDLGAGVLYPFIAKTDDEKKTLLHEIGPVWDGNEVWLLTAGGALFAAFAPAYAATFSGFYLAIMLVLFGLIVRAVSIEFRARDEQPARLFDALFFVGSLLPALLFGVAVGNVAEGVALNANGDYTGSFIGLLNPFALLCGVLGLVHMMAQGASWVSLKSSVGSELRERAVGLRKKLSLAAVVVFALVTVVFLTAVLPGLGYSVGSRGLAVAAAVLYAVCMLAAAFACRGDDPGRDLAAQLLASIAAALLVVLLAATLFPNLVPAADPALSLTIANSASSDTALSAMTVIACIGVPIMLVYHVIVYRTFRGRLES